MRRFMLVIGVLSVVALYMLTVATGHASKLSDYFWWLLGFNGLLLLALVMVVGRQLWQLWRDGRQRVFGVQLSRRLAWMFVAVTVLPGLFLFAVSAQFISHSIHSWFGTETEEALQRSLSLSKVALNSALDDTVRQAMPIQVELIRAASLQDDFAAVLRSAQPPSGGQGFSQMAVYRMPDGQALARLGREKDLAWPDWAELDQGQLSATGSMRYLSNLNGKLYAQVWLILPPMEGQPHQVAFFRQPVAKDIARDATLIEAARAKYAELTYAKKGLQTFFLMTLLMATLLAIMLALVLALYFARRFVAPLASLAEATRAVAQGDFSQKSPVFRSDELGMLSGMFNRMTEQLQMAQTAAEQNRLRQEAARHYLERVLSSLTTGVLTFDEQGHLRAYNGSAEEILGVKLDQRIDSRWQDWADVDEPQWACVITLIEQIMNTALEQRTVQLDYVGPDQAQMVLARATPLPQDSGRGVVLVFDDVTELVQAQKDAAWGEVAKRLAHEIRNPLTPIQLSAERLAWKLTDKLGEDDARILTRSTDTIIKQVGALKEMVEAFRNYARSPSLKLEVVDLNQIVSEVLVLYEGASCTFSPKLSTIALPVQADTAMMRQVLHNIFKNAAEAAESDEAPQVWVETEANEPQAVLRVCNNGKGFSPQILQQAFEPYVTDKANGTGLGLSVVKKIIDEHRGRISLANREPTGAQVKIALPLLEK